MKNGAGMKNGTGMKNKLLLPAALALLALAGCSVGPQYARPRVDAPAAYRGPDEKAMADADKDSLGDRQWSTVFRQPELQELIRTALADNYDLRIAAERILEQDSQVRIARAQQFPTFNIGGTGAGAELPSTLGSSIASPLSFGSFNVSAAWTPDFWGLYRKQTEAARDQLLAQTWAQRAVRMTLVQQVVTTYLQLRALDGNWPSPAARSKPATSRLISRANSKPPVPCRSPIFARPRSCSTPPPRRSRSSNNRFSRERTKCNSSSDTGLGP